MVYTPHSHSERGSLIVRGATVAMRLAARTLLASRRAPPPPLCAALRRRPPCGGSFSRSGHSGLPSPVAEAAAAEEAAAAVAREEAGKARVWSESLQHAGIAAVAVVAGSIVGLIGARPTASLLRAAGWRTGALPR